jgi:stage III sporulation protein AB
MQIQWIGAALIVADCGGIGFSMVIFDKREMDAIRSLLDAVSFMRKELCYRVTPLPELCRKASDACSGCVRRFFSQLAIELERQIAPDVACCLTAAMAKSPDIPEKTRMLLERLGTSLGFFGLEEQLTGLDALIAEGETIRQQLEQNRTQRLRGYQTLALCAGAALAILFL